MKTDYELVLEGLETTPRINPRKDVWIPALTRLRDEAAKVPGLVTDNAALTESALESENARVAAESERDAAQKEAHRLSNALALEQTTRDRAVGERDAAHQQAKDRADDCAAACRDRDQLSERVATLEQERDGERMAREHLELEREVWRTAEARVKELAEACERLYLRHKQEAADASDEPTKTAHRYAMGVAETLGAVARDGASQPPPTPAQVRHATKENGDCPHWCEACRMEAQARAKEPAPPSLVEAVEPVIEHVRWVQERPKMADAAHLSGQRLRMEVSVPTARALLAAYDAAKGATAPVPETFDKADVALTLRQVRADAVGLGDRRSGWRYGIDEVAARLGLTLDTPPSGPGGDK